MFELQHEIAETQNSHINESVLAHNGVFIHKILDVRDGRAAGEEHPCSEESHSFASSTLPPPYKLEPK